MSQRAWNRSLLFTSLIAVAVSAVSVWLEWNTSGTFTLRLSLLALALVLGAAGVSYSLRIIRFHLLLSQSGVQISLPSTALAQGVGFALSVTPGLVGELFKLHLIQQRVGTPLLQTAPVLLLDHAMEGAGFLIFALISAAAFPSFSSRLPEASLLTASLILLLLLALLRRQVGHAIAIGQARLSRLTVGRRLLPYLRKAWRGMESSLTPRQLFAGLALTALARVADGLVLLLAAQMLGVTLALPVAIFVIALSGFAGGISLLPGGAGAAETTMTGLLTLSGAPLASALAITLLARVSTLWLWVGLGLGMAFILHLAPVRLNRPQRT
jgi:uncharacterized protein (TIRG00374 family)